jgi:anaerobic selenocysteine-containing dehydrogenase
MFEIESYQEYAGRVELRRKVIEPLGEARNDYLIFAELAVRLGYGQRWPQTERDMVELATAGHRRELRAAGREPRRGRAAGAATALPQVRDR